MGKTDKPKFWMYTSAIFAKLNPLFWMSALVERFTADTTLKGEGILGHLGGENGIPREALHQDWMGSIHDKKPISQISVPGTHDSAAYNYQGEDNNFWNCQNVPLFGQLDAGIRALDLRYGLREGKLLFFHATALLDENAEVLHILRGLHAWLKEHRTETIFVSLKVDNGVPDADDVQKAMDHTLNSCEEGMWLTDPTTRTTLGEARGKLILLRRFPFMRQLAFDVSSNWGYNSEYFGIRLNEDGTNMAWIEDFYLLKGYPRNEKEQIKIKWEHTKTHLQRAQAELETDDNNLWITFSSAVGDRVGSKTEDVTPRVMALGRDTTIGMNQHLIDWCKETDKRPVGIVLMDFINLRREGQSNDNEVPEFDLIRGFIEKQGNS